MECERLHDSGRYSATLLTTTRGVSLVIESKAAKGQKRGVQLMDCAEWADALRTALDANERDDLCRAIWRR